MDRENENSLAPVSIAVRDSLADLAARIVSARIDLSSAKPDAVLSEYASALRGLHEAYLSMIEHGTL